MRIQELFSKVQNPEGFLRKKRVLGPIFGFLSDFRLVAWQGGILCRKRGRGASLIAKDLIDSEDPKHTLFCRQAEFVAKLNLS